MIGEALPLATGEEAARVVRALGRHRYVSSRLHLVHALVFASIDSETLAACPNDDLQEGTSWATRALSGPLDRTSRDDRLWRKASEAEVATLLEIYWSLDRGAKARTRLEGQLREIGANVDATPFDEEAEATMFPVLIDCGWELLPLSEFDQARHKGAIDSFGSPFDFSIALFNEDAAMSGGVAPAYLQELSAIGPAELVRGLDGAGALREPPVLYNEGPEPYLDYVLRGALKSAKLERTP